MELAQTFALVAILAALVIIIYMTSRPKPTDSDGVKTDLGTKSSGGTTGSASKIVVKMPVQKHYTIYEYRPAKQMKICLQCDGENEMTASFCCICGKRLAR